jgi:phosphopantothenoylcysteine decarboxylase/phosphopantothenate--cysteine ligase
MRIVLGVTGGIAAYKATSIIRLLTEAGHEVKVVPTQNALRFIGATTLEALSHNAVDPDLYTDVESVKHVELGKSADLVIVAPATASFLARYAAGIADDLLGNVLLATNAPVLVAPAMHTEMWNNAATIANVETLKFRGIEVLTPESGRLTGEDTGVGRLPDPEDIVAAALALTGKRDLHGKRILVTAGGTREAIDPVRYIGNNSSGKQGLAIAREAVRRGAKVTVLAANLGNQQISGATVIVADTAIEMERQVNHLIQDQDVFIAAAAISDFRVAEVSPTKLKRSQLGNQIDLRLVANPDILAGVVSRIREEGLAVTSIGFAAETAGSHWALAELAKAKLGSKGCDVIVANDVSESAVFGSDHNDALIITRAGKERRVTGTKTTVASAVLDILTES